MYSRSELRHVCFRAKNNAVSDQQKSIKEMIESLLSVGQRFENFTTLWDVLVTKSGDVKIIKPETDYDYIHSTLIEASLYTRQKISFDCFDDRQSNIITQVESLMLENLMNWENYNRVWGVELDPTLKTMKTKLYNVDPRQKQVTDEMIEASKKDADGSALSTPVPNVLETKPMTDQQAKEFEAFLAKKYSQKG
jgi:hypothetical protein